MDSRREFLKKAALLSGAAGLPTARQFAESGERVRQKRRPLRSTGRCHDCRVANLLKECFERLALEDGLVWDWHEDDVVCADADAPSIPASATAMTIAANQRSPVEA